jgi:hypothetical protein
MIGLGAIKYGRAAILLSAAIPLVWFKVKGWF